MRYERGLHIKFKFMFRFQRVNIVPLWKSSAALPPLNRHSVLTRHARHKVPQHSNGPLNERVRGATNSAAFEVSRTRSCKRHQMRQCIISCGVSELLRSGSGEKRLRAFVALQFLMRF